MLAGMKRRSLLQAGLSLAAAPLAPLAPLPPVASPLDAPCPRDLAPLAPSARPAYERVVARVGTNHGHVFTVSLADVSAGVARVYDLTGTAGHEHRVTLEPAVFERLRAGEIVRLPSSRDGHLHRLLVRLAPAVDPPEATAVCAVTIGGKDDHELIVTAADMAARADRTYDIQGIAAHTHAVRIVAADFERLARGEQLALNASAAQPGEDHGHVVYVHYPPARGKRG